MSRVRFCFTKVGKIRWTSHRDLARMWERAFRRIELPLAYTEGFSPRPKVSFGLALPTGHESVAEYLDVELAPTAEADVANLPGRLSAALPLGVDVSAAGPVPAGTPSLQEAVTSCTWCWSVGPVLGTEAADPVDPAVLAARVDALLAAPTVVVTRTRKGQPVTSDIRPAVLDLRLLGARPDGSAGPDRSEGAGGSGGEVWLEAELACRPTSLRPSEVLAALDPDLEVRRARRTHQWISRDGARREPLPIAVPDVATAAPHAWERAS
jgi:radical SAM-linked protein